MKIREKKQLIVISSMQQRGAQILIFIYTIYKSHENVNHLHLHMIYTYIVTMQMYILYILNKYMSL